MHFFLSKRFLPLFITQFLGAFNDNFFKNALVVLITYRLAAESGLNGAMMVAAAAGIFILPYFLFSALSGQLADKIDRTIIARMVKIAEIILMLLASVGFYFGNIWFLMAVLFGMGVHSTFFGPIKFALLPQHLHSNELMPGNAAIEAGTFLSILLGTIAGGVMIMLPNGTMLVAAALLLVAVTGLLSAMKIPPAPPPEPSLTIRYNLVTETIALIKAAKKDKPVFQAILGISWFWFIGATFLAQFPPYAKESLNAGASVVTFFLTVFSIGIGIGSFLCNALSKGQVTLRYAFWSLIGISVFAFDLSLASAHPHIMESNDLIDLKTFLSYPKHWRILFDLLMVSICGGIYIVPLYAFLQHKGDISRMARLIATNNIMNALYMVSSAILLMGLVSAKVAIPKIFLVVAVLNLVMALWTRRNT